MGSGDASDTKTTKSFMWAVLFLVVIPLIIYNLYTGLTIGKIGLPGGFSIEFNSGNPPPNTNVSSGKVEPPPSDTPKPAPPVTGTIFIRYTGDQLGCMLTLRIKIGKKSFVPTSNPYLISDIGLGEADYEIKGQISCPYVGICNASGSGSINVEDGATYDLVWVNTGIGVCSTELVQP